MPFRKVHMKKPLKKSRAAGKRKATLIEEIDRADSVLARAKYVLRLYINGSTLKSTLAVKNIKRICEQHLNGLYDLEIIDIYKHVSLARDEQIVAVPTLIKQFPHPLRRLIGDLSDQDKVLFGLDLKIQE
jgi:circadian clock protein KaiB